MIAEGLKFLTELKDQRPITVKVDGNEYAVTEDRTLGEIVAPPVAPTLGVATLTGLLEAYERKIDDLTDHVALHVIDHLTVVLVDLCADQYGRRHEYVRAVCGESNPFPFNAYQTPENFLINLQIGFLPTENVIKLQQLASSLTNENSISTGDDGISQTVVVKSGTVTRVQVELPRRIELLAYRTFREIDPTTGEFMVRMKGKPGELPTVALLEVDAGKWKLTAMQQIAAWLKARASKAVVIA